MNLYVRFYEFYNDLYAVYINEKLFSDDELKNLLWGFFEPRLNDDDKTILGFTDKNRENQIIGRIFRRDNCQDEFDEYLKQLGFKEVEVNSFQVDEYGFYA